MPPPWDALGIEPTVDAAVVRRAYAARLKSVRPEDDPEGFQRLRAAYEAALKAVQPKMPEQPAQAAHAAEEAPADTERPQWPAEVREEVERLQSAFSGGDSEAAVKAMEEARARQSLPAALEAEAARVLIGILFRDRTIAPERLREIAEHFGWYGVPDAMRGPNGEGERILCLRIDAELWLKDMRRQASLWQAWLGRSQAAAARLVLGSGPILLSRFVPPNPRLMEVLGAAFMYAPVLEGSLDEQRLERLAAYSDRGEALARTIRSVSYPAWLGVIGLGIAKPMLERIVNVDAVRTVLAVLLILILASGYIRRWVRPVVVYSWIGVLLALAYALDFKPI